MAFLDQKLVVVEDEFDKLMAMPDNVMGTCLENDDLETIAGVLRGLRSLNRSSALATAKLLHSVNAHWNEFSHDEGDTFVYWATRETGYNSETVKKNVSVWEFLNGGYIPKQHRARFNDHTMKQLTKEYSLCITPHEKDGKLEFIQEDYGLKDENWLALSECVDGPQTSALVMELKGKERNENYISFKIDADGSLWYFSKKSNGTIGQLFTEHKSELVREAVRCLLERAKIREFERV